MKRNQRGVTLISLVVTIVVMLIIAGAAISTLGGENGIITQSQNSRVMATQADVVEKMQLAYSAVNQKVMMKTSTDFSYNPQEHIAEYVTDIISDLKDVNQIDDTTTTDAINGALDSGFNVFVYNNSIYMVYKDNTFALGVPKTADSTYPIETLDPSTTFPQNKQYAMLVGQIVLTTNSISYNDPIKTVQ